VYFDLHIHSIYSKDSLLRPRQIIKLAKYKDLDVVGITDHNTIKGGLITKQEAMKQKNILVIVGSEIKTNFGDVIGLFLNEEIHKRDFCEVIDAIYDQGGIVILPHPYRRKRFPPETMLKKIHIIEGINGRTSNKLNENAILLARKLDKPIIGGSDAHFPFEIGTVRNFISREFLGEEELRKALLKGYEIQVIPKLLPAPVRKVNSLVGFMIKKVREAI